jgi:hypothetical protein
MNVVASHVGLLGNLMKRKNPYPQTATGMDNLKIGEGYV